MLKIFWDSYGLSNAHSGISVHGKALWDNLPEKPTLLSPLKITRFDRLIPFKTIRHATQTQRQIDESTKAIFHGLSNYNLPLFSQKNVAYVATIHDLIPLLYPDFFDFKTRAHAKVGLTHISRRAGHVICVSDWTRESLIHFHPELKKRSTVIRNGYDHFDAKPRPFRDSVPQKILSISRWEKYKRFEILKAFDTHFEITLVTDDQGEQWAKENLNVVKHRIFKNLNKTSLQKLFQETDLYVQPSIAEGFCLPAVEAAISGVPVIYTEGSGIDEALSSFPNKIGLSPTAKPQEWLSATQAKFSSLPASKLNLHSWATAAQSLLRIYNLIPI